MTPAMTLGRPDVGRVWVAPVGATVPAPHPATTVPTSSAGATWQPPASVCRGGRPHRLVHLVRLVHPVHVRSPHVVRAAPEPAPVSTEEGDELVGVPCPDEHLDVGRGRLALQRLQHRVEVVDRDLLSAR